MDEMLIECTECNEHRTVTEHELAHVYHPCPDCGKTARHERVHRFTCEACGTLVIDRFQYSGLFLVCRDCAQRS